MKSKAVQFLEAHQSGERSTFVEDAKWRQENASWLKRSRRVAHKQDWWLAAWQYHL